MKNAICYLFSFLVEAIIIWQYTSNLFVSKRSDKTKFVVLCSLYFVLFVISLFESEWLNAVIYFTVNYIFLITQCELKWNSAFFHSSILIAVMGMCELVAYGIFKYFRPHFLENGRDFPSLLIYAIFNKLLFFTVTYILTHLFRGRRKGGLQDDKSVCLLIFIPLTSVFVMLTFISIDEMVNLLPPYNWMITLSAFFLLVSNLLVFGINQ